MVIYNPIYNQFLAPLYEIVVLEYLFIVLAERRGYDTANYRNSEKVTKF